jgi:NAD(P)-dependent dehydrogenase (short-subunit alcohol dehydrogenase family)
MNIAKKTVLITGANRGIGLALVNEALRWGATRVYAGARGILQHSDKRVTPLTLDVTSVSQVQQAVEQVDALDVLINNAGVANYDDLSNLEVIELHLAVNFLGMLKVTHAFFATAEALPRGHREQPVIGRARCLADDTGLLHFEGSGVQHDAVIESTLGRRRREGSCRRPGPIDTDMNRGLEIPKASPESAAAGVFDGLERGEEEIFPDPASLSIAEGWRNGAVKAMERQFAAFVPNPAAN